ncbi:MAG: histidine kinase [Hyphomicrobiaceae bacterium]
MPSLVRFLSVVGIIAGVTYGTLYVLAVYFEPSQREVTKPVHGIKIRKE